MLLLFFSLCFKALVWSQFNLQLTKQPQHDHNMGVSPKWANAVHQQTNQYRVTATLCLCCLPTGIMTIDCLIYLNGVKFTSCHHGHWANDILRLCKSSCPLYHCVLIWVRTFSLLPSLTKNHNLIFPLCPSLIKANKDQLKSLGALLKQALAAKCSRRFSLYLYMSCFLSLLCMHGTMLGSLGARVFPGPR